MPRGRLTFVFDDGYDDVYRLVVPLLEKHGFHGVFAIPLDSHSLAVETKQTLRPVGDWVDITLRGHEIAAHSIRHVNLTHLSIDDLQQELSVPAQQLQASTVVYPGGAYNDVVVSAVRKFYKAARTVQKGFNDLHPTDPYRLKTYNFTKTNFSVFKANALAVWAWLTNSWLIETYHLVTDHESDLLHSTKLTDLEKHIEFVKKLGISVQTIQNI